MDNHTPISISTGTIVRAFAVAVLVWALYSARTIVLIVLSAVVISSALEPAVVALVKRRVPRVAAVIGIFLAFLAFVALFVSYFIPFLMSDVLAFFDGIPGYMMALSQNAAIVRYADLLGLPSPASLTVADLVSGARDALSLGGVGSTVGFMSLVFSGMFSLVLTVVFSFYLTLIGTGVDTFLRIVMPPSHKDYALRLWKRTQHKIGLWLQGQLILALIMGVLVFLGLSILGVPHALVLAVITACFEIIPVFGPTLSAIPAVALAATAGGASLGLATLALYVIAQQFEHHLIYPLVVTRIVGVPPLLVVLSLIVGAHFAGFFGIILAVPIAATIQELARETGSGKLQEELKS